MRTQTNFYKSKNLNDGKGNNLKQSADQKLLAGPSEPLGQINGIPIGHNIHDTANINVAGDRVPTRERQHRSAHNNVRRRDITRQ